jgi:hypothetical protein
VDSLRADSSFAISALILAISASDDMGFVCWHFRPEVFRVQAVYHADRRASLYAYRGRAGFCTQLARCRPGFCFFSYFPPQHFHTISIDSACWCGVIMPLTMTYKQRDWTKLLIITVVFATALLAVLRGVPKGSGVALCGLLVAVGVCMKRITGHYFK